ncbi:MAG: TetR/AcrR family transcriptional regulator [Burkholderiales bacterium]|nr:TetR/AcrR family transcriptional regulator [Burkholderiales bacterium]
MLDIAERLAQTRGFNGFSYSDIAADLGIAKASLHHHFPTKADLGRALMQRYSDSFEAALAGIDASGEDAYGRLSRYMKLYERVLVDDRLCLCGMLAAEYSTLPAGMRVQVRRFFEKNEDWVAALVERGRREKSLRPGAPARDVARMIVSALEGAMVLARSCEDPARFASSVRPVLAELKAKAVRKNR